MHHGKHEPVQLWREEDSLVWWLYWTLHTFIHLADALIQNDVQILHVERMAQCVSVQSQGLACYQLYSRITDGRWVSTVCLSVVYR